MSCYQQRTDQTRNDANFTTKIIISNIPRVCSYDSETKKLSLQKRPLKKKKKKKSPYMKQRKSISSSQQCQINGDQIILALFMNNPFSDKTK